MRTGYQSKQHALPALSLHILAPTHRLASSSLVVKTKQTPNSRLDSQEERPNSRIFFLRCCFRIQRAFEFHLVNYKFQFVATTSYTHRQRDSEQYNYTHLRVTSNALLLVQGHSYCFVAQSSSCSMFGCCRPLSVIQQHYAYT